MEESVYVYINLLVNNDRLTDTVCSSKILGPAYPSSLLSGVTFYSRKPMPLSYRQWPNLFPSNLIMIA
jgi:hypothetical protein